MFESSRAVKSPSLRSPRTDRLFWKLLAGVSVFLLTPEASLGSFFGLRSACSKVLESSPESEASSNAAKRRVLEFPFTRARGPPGGPAPRAPGPRTRRPRGRRDTSRRPVPEPIHHDSDARRWRPLLT